MRRLLALVLLLGGCGTLRVDVTGNQQSLDDHTFRLGRDERYIEQLFQRVTQVEMKVVGLENSMKNHKHEPPKK